MERYKEYKDSGVPSWIGQVPNHWKTYRFGNLCKMKSICNCVDEDLLSVYLDRGVIRFSDDDNRRTNPTSKDLTNYQLVEPGDFVLNNQQAWRGSVGVSKYRGIISPAYFVFSLSPQLNVNFANLMFRSNYYIAYYYVCSKGIGSIQRNLVWDYLKQRNIFLPPLTEQERIVSYLEDKTSKIDSYVAEKEKEIKLLQELKQKTIADAVTKGLNPDVKLKDFSSLISSYCPEHWKIVRNKSVFSLTGEKVGNKARDYLLLSLTTKGVIVRDIESGKGKFPKEFDTYQVVRKGELVFCLFDIDETPRTVGLVEIEGMLTGAYTALKVNTQYALPEYLYFYYLCVDNIKALKPYYSGLRKTVRAEKFLQIYIPLPPKEEQQTIVTYIKEKCQKIDTLVTELQAEIDYMNEYKQRLIADCVTGQVNVQNIKHQ